MYKYISVFIFTLMVLPSAYGIPSSMDLEEYRIFPLHKAAESGDAYLVSQLLNEGAYIEINSKDKDGNTAFHIAAKKGHVEVGLVLLLAGASVHIEDDRHGDPVPHTAVRHGQIEFVKAIIQWDETIAHITNYYEQNLVHTAIIHSEENVHSLAPFLFDKGVSLYARDRGGNTYLHTAAQFGRIFSAIFVLTIEQNSIHMRNTQGNTPLLTAAQYGSANTLLSGLLIRAGSDETVVNRRGESYPHVQRILLNTLDSGMKDNYLLNKQKSLLESLPKAPW